MKFSILLFALAGIIKLSLKTNKSIRELIRYKDNTYVIMTKDGKRGIRFIISNGTFVTDRVLTDYDLAMVWKDAETGFRVLTSGDPVGMQRAIANWDLELYGNKSLSVWFTIFLGFATGALKRK